MISQKGPVIVSYRDHLLFQRMNPADLSPPVRKAIGWIEYEDEQSIRLVWDTPVSKVAEEKTPPEQSGLIILKSDIIEVKPAS